jgi:hypothetical protein
MFKWLASLFKSKPEREEKCPHRCEGGSPKSYQSHLFEDCRVAKDRGVCSSLSLTAIRVTDSFGGPRSSSGGGVTD